MKIGVIKEIKDKENRVALTPDGAKDLIAVGHDVFLEDSAGKGSGYENQEYESLGVNIVSTEEAWDADLVIKIKEPLEQEFHYFKDNILFTYLHLAGVPESLTKALIAARTTAIAYETVENNEGGFPLLAPMSAVAGNMAATVGAYYLAKFNQGKGIQLGRILGERHGKVMVIGNGIVGQHAAITADGLGANVFIMGRDERKFLQHEKTISDNIKFIYSTPENISAHIKDTDLLIGAVLLPGAKAPHLVSEAMVKHMQAGSVIVDVAIDQGGCIETSHVTSHTDPVFIKHNVIHYCVSNMPGAYPRTSTIALTKSTLPYIINLANNGEIALKEDKGFAAGVNTYNGYITYKPVAESLDMNSLYKIFSDIE
jgi:alanine dehydrogenase